MRGATECPRAALTAEGATPDWILRMRLHCTIDECGLPHHGSGLCQIHYKRWKRHGSFESRRLNGSLLERFLLQIRPTEASCWEWAGNINVQGYGRITSVVSAHRFSYQYFVGCIPADLVIDHLCRNTKCVNPDHLETVTPRENLLRGVHPLVVIHHSGTCARGHEFNEENIYFRLDRPGRWNCRACRRLVRKD